VLDGETVVVANKSGKPTFLLELSSLAWICSNRSTQLS
jgi:hypothetical protein